MTEETVYWLPFKREEIAQMLCVPGLERVYEIGVKKVRAIEALERARPERLSLTELELEL